MENMSLKVLEKSLNFYSKKVYERWIYNELICVLLLHCTLGLMKQSTTLPCGHSGCMKCMKEARSIRQCCPKCRDTEVPTFSRNISMDAMVAAVEAKFLAVGCPWKGLFKDAEDHQRECSCVDHRQPKRN